MAYTTPPATPTPPPSSGQPADTQAAPALPFGVSREQYDAAVLDAQARGLDPNAPTMNEATKSLEQAITAFPEVTAPEQYDLSQYPVDDSDGDAAATMEFDAWRRSALQAAGVPAEMAGGLVSACVAAEKRFANQTPDDREVTIRNTNAAMTRLWGNKAASNIELANRFLDYVESRQPGVLAYLDASGAANDPAVIAAVWMQAERFLATGGKL